MYKLKYISDIINLGIISYSPYIVEFENWIISDEYTEPKNSNIEYGTYRVIVEVKEELNVNILSEKALETNVFLSKLNKLLTYTTSVSLNSPKNHINNFSKLILLHSDVPKGWSSNYECVEKNLEKSDSPGIRIKMTIGTEQWSVLKLSPLKELSEILSIYGELDEHIKSLIEFHSKAKENENHIRYLILGKVLEIIDQLIPNKTKNKDTRINDFYPELIPVFKNTTIKELRCLANKRIETRHYKINKESKLPLPSLTQNEAEEYYSLIDILAFSIVRKELGLETVTIVNK